MVSQFFSKYPIVSKAISSIQGRWLCAERCHSITHYVFQDVIAQTGGWKTFTELYYKQYNTYLPFYPLSDSYIPDEINPEDIAFVLWTLKSHFALYGPDEYTLQNPYDKDLLALAQEAYKMMDEKFEEAPINEKTSSFLWVMGPDLLDMPFVPLPEITPETKLSKDVEHCLEYSGGNLYYILLPIKNSASSLLKF